MVLSTSQQAVIGFTAVLFTFVVLPRMFGVGIGTGGATKETRFDRFNRKVGPGPGAVRGQPVGMNAPGSAQTIENMQHMKMMMEQEMKNEKFKPNTNKGYVFTLMPLYAIGVGVFAAYKFLKIKSADNNSQAQKSKVVKGVKKSAEAESQLNELEQRLAQTERMLNSILTQLDPLTNCVKIVAQEQKNEIMSQLQTIRYLMKKRGMDCPPVNIQESSCDRNLDDLIKSLAAHETLPSDAAQGGGGQSCAAAADAERSEQVCDDEYHKPDDNDEATSEEETQGKTLDECKREVKESDVEQEQEEEEEGRHEDEEEADEGDLLPSREDSDETHIEDIGALHHGTAEQQPPCGLRRRTRPE